ncbi:hypothetical protein WN51_09929 [Melipona quadrifasciata]|uniref:Uncharacterized protein n=1 Tax=Melipona quadrifasciata TaxID=166423 RepID=A0A0N0BJG8_9HYME|nr:hypothetical protein WN51_09929 [Melipona quadrifasciata]
MPSGAIRLCKRETIVGRKLPRHYDIPVREQKRFTSLDFPVFLKRQREELEEAHVHRIYDRIVIDFSSKRFQILYMAVDRQGNATLTKRN